MTDFSTLNVMSAPSGLMAYIEFLETRLECDHVYRMNGEGADPVRTPLSREERLQMITSGADGIACRDATIFLLKEQRSTSAAASGDRAQLSDLVAIVMKRAWFDGFKAASDTASSVRISPCDEVIAPGRESIVNILQGMLERYVKDLPAEPEIMRENRESMAMSFRSRRNTASEA